MGEDMAQSILRLSLLVFIVGPFLSANAAILESSFSSATQIQESLTSEHPFVMELGIEYLHPQFPAIQNIVIQNSVVSNTSATGTVASDYPDAFAQTLKLQALLNPNNQWTASLKTFLPLNSLTQVDTGNLYQPEYVLYRSDLQRPRIHLMSGLNLNPSFRIGFGLDFGFSVNSQANVFLQSGTNSAGQTTYSDQRISAKVKPTIAPEVSAQYQDVALTIRAENKSTFDLSANASALVFGNRAQKDFDYTSSSVLFFDPWRFDLDTKTNLSDQIKLLYGVSYQLWSRFQAPAAVINGVTTNNCNGQSGCSTTFSPGLAPAFQAHNIFVPTLGVQWQQGEHRYQVRYRYKDSIFKGLPTTNQSGNYLDPPRHDLLLETGFLFASGVELSFHGQVSRLVSQNVVKSNPDEIGAPGYTVSGWLYGGGVDLSIPLKL